MSVSTPHPTDLVVHGTSRELEISFADGQNFRIPFELMRVYSPSAEVQGHGPGQEVLQTGKREVTLEAMTAACSPGSTCTFWVRSRHSCGTTMRNACRPPG